MTPARCVILMYHRVSDAPTDPEEGDYVLPQQLFEQQLRWLAAGGRPVVPLAALAAGDQPNGSIVLTFDDGSDSDLAVARQLSELGLAAAFFISPALLGTPGRLTWEQLRWIAGRGFEVGAHGLDHAMLDDLDEGELRRQLEVSKACLETQLERPCSMLSLPNGSGGARVQRAARAAGYRIILGSRPGIVKGMPACAVLPRFAVRCGRGSFDAFRAAVEQRGLFRARQGLRYAAAQLARTLIGTSAYRRLRVLWLLRFGADRAGHEN